MTQSIQLWADSVGKGITFDEARGRYVILPSRCAVGLQEALGKPVINHSRMGATAPEGLAGFMQSEAEEGDIVVVAYGGNDCDMPWKEVATHPEASHEGCIPLSRFQETLEKFVSAIRARGMRPLLVTPPPLEAQRYFDWVTKDLSKEAVLRYLGDVPHIYRWQERYSIAVRRVAEATRCALFDLRDAFLAHMRYPSLLCVDGIHPNAEGHALITQAVIAQRDKLMAHLRAEEGCPVMPEVSMA